MKKGVMEIFTGMPHRYLRRQRTEQEKLYAAGWFTTGNGEFWKHPKIQDRAVTRRAAVKLQTAWEE